MFDSDDEVIIEMSVDYLNILTNAGFPLLQGILSNLDDVFWPGPLTMGDPNGSYFLHFAEFHIVNFTGPVDIFWDTRSDAPHITANLTNLDIKVLLYGYLLINTAQFKSNVTL